MGNDGGDTDPQHTPGIPHTRTVHGHIADLLDYPRFVGLIQIVQLEAMTAITAAVALDTTSRFTMAVDQLTLAGRTFHRRNVSTYFEPAV